MSLSDVVSDERASLVLVLEAVAGGDEAAFEELYRRTAAKLFGLCLGIVHDRSLAEDVLQEAYLSVWNRAGAFDATRGSAMTWLITLTRNRAIDRLRAGGKMTSVPIDRASEIPDAAPSALAIASAEQERRRLLECLELIPPGDALLIRTAFLEGSSYSELATRSATPLGTVKTRIRKALSRLRECMA